MNDTEDQITTARDNATEAQKEPEALEAPDFVRDHTDPETGDTVRVLTMADASDPKKLEEALASTGADEGTLEYDHERMSQTIRERAVYLQGLDVRDPAITDPAVFLGA